MSQPLDIKNPEVSDPCPDERSIRSFRFLLQLILTVCLSLAPLKGEGNLISGPRENDRQTAEAMEKQKANKNYYEKLLSFFVGIKMPTMREAAIVFYYLYQKIEILEKNYGYIIKPADKKTTKRLMDKELKNIKTYNLEIIKGYHLKLTQIKKFRNSPLIDEEIERAEKLINLLDMAPD